MNEPKNQLRKPFLGASDSGFTLVEMLIVITLIALIGTLGISQVIKSFQKAKVKSTIVTIQQLGQALDTLKIDCGRYPTTEEGLAALVERPPTLNCKNYDEDGYVKGKKIPKDGFDADFLYFSDSPSKYKVLSYGEDQKEGGTGLAADISSDEEEESKQ